MVLPMKLVPSAGRRARATAAALSVAVVAGASAWFSPAAPAADSDPMFEADAVAETTPSDLAGDTMDDPAIWIDPSNPANSAVIAADHDDHSLTVYDLKGERLHKLPLPHGNNVDVRPNFPFGGQNVPLVGLAGSGLVSFYTLDPATRKLTSVTPGGATIKASALGGPSGLHPHGMCMYQSPKDGGFYAFVVDNHGIVLQLQITDGGNGKIAHSLVRTIDIQARPPEGNPDQTEACVADEETGSLFIAEQDWHIWRYGAEKDDPTGVSDRVKVDDEVSEGGHFVREAEGLAVVHPAGGPSYLIASSQKMEIPGRSNSHGAFTIYQATPPYDFVRNVAIVDSPLADGCENTDGIDATAASLGPDFPYGIFICQDNNNREPNPGNMNFKYARLDAMLPPIDPTATTTTTPTTAPPVTTTTVQNGHVPGPAAKSGYWMLGSDGQVYNFGDAAPLGTPQIKGGATAVDLEPTPDNAGYWIVDDKGQVHVQGAAVSHGSVPAGRLAAGETVTSLSSTRTGNGYWIFTSAGRVFAFGDATHRGDMAGIKLNGPVLDSITTASGNGYYMVGSDGGIFTFGDAVFRGSTGDVKLNAPVQSLVPTPDGQGYWLVASDGGVFSFDAPFRGSLADVKLNKPITGMVPFGNGYLMLGTDGGAFNFSDRPFSGSLGDKPPAKPVVAVAALR
jgi:myo-inositol-hexaphosphate 3-phosphohydrolase